MSVLQITNLEVILIWIQTEQGKWEKTVVELGNELGKEEHYFLT